MMVRKIDELGRIVLPAEFRRELKIGTNCEMKIELKEGIIVLTPNECLCSNCKTVISAYAKYKLCDNCISTIRKED